MSKRTTGKKEKKRVWDRWNQVERVFWQREVEGAEDRPTINPASGKATTTREEREITKSYEAGPGQSTIGGLKKKEILQFLVKVRLRVDVSSKKHPGARKKSSILKKRMAITDLKLYRTVT